jgi:SAM-dependent methyltransferase
VPDLSAALPSTELDEAFLRVVDAEGKLIAALEDLGPVAGRDVVLLDAGRGFHARQLSNIGARVTSVAFPPHCDEASAVALIAELPAGEADTVIVPWSELAAPGSAFVAEAERLLRPGGRLLLVHDYGRDDVWCLWPDHRHRVLDWSRRRGPFLGDGFRIRVIHCWWTFESAEQAQSLLGAAFGASGVELADQMKRLRLEYQVAIYHRSAPGSAPAPAEEAEVEMAGLGIAGAAGAAG